MGNLVIANLARQAAKRGLNVRLRADGVSMFPYIWPGDMVTFRPIREGETPQRGAVTVTETEEQDRFILHRVVKSERDSIITRGDSNMANDAPHTLTQIIGVLTKVESSRFHFSWHVGEGRGLWSAWMLGAAPVSYGINHALVLTAQFINSLLKRVGLRHGRKTPKA